MNSDCRTGSGRRERAVVKWENREGVSAIFRLPGFKSGLCYFPAVYLEEAG